MKPVMQNVRNTETGNCFSACVASIFELDISEVPNFIEAGRNWMNEYNLWLEKFGLTSFEMDVSDDNRETWRKWLDHKDNYSIISVVDDKIPHALVMKGTKIVHDPFENNCKSFVFDDIYAFGMFVMKDPGSLIGFMKEQPFMKPEVTEEELDGLPD